MMTVKTIPIKATTPITANKNSLKWQKFRNRSIGFLVALVPPTICAYVMVRWVLGGSNFLENGGLFLNSYWGTALISVILLCCMLNSMANCSPGIMLFGFASTVLLNFMPHGSGIAAVIVGVTLLISLNVAMRVYEKLQAKICGPLTLETRNELNPRCETCHVRRVCPYQPGGIADRYTDQP